ncbi:cytochrome c [Pseudomonas denitrificans (nom. rej.)]|uniref:C-type cytochrome n=1 Tax=Pseudomonas denitrificans TaxID=43306 RepID=A0A9X7MXI5_PSEDE|nr:cytochrome c [Pseudomonas denitrificans (nom. rej.)]QEY71115.1 c-type cytochrome [Pseudomonas denitrificans (nom. rej.)]
MNKTSLAIIGGLAALVVTGVIATGKPSIAPIDPPAAQSFSAEAIARGQQLAALGDCAVCHTRDGGAPLTGGRAMVTPFGTLYTSNLTPDRETGIGVWSFEAFKRAMREGISREGDYLYPAFPYTAFTRVGDEDLRDLYAYLMTRPAAVADTPDDRLPFPYNQRRIMAGWNFLFFDKGVFQPQPHRDAAWNRGAYLVEGLGHCSACHTPRNALGAERTGKDRFAGATVDGWQVPPLNGGSKPAIPWTQATLYDYLRNGFSRYHGAAAGPMAPVAAGLTQQPDADLQAMARYLATFLPEQTGDFSPEQRAVELEQRTYGTLQPVSGSGGRIFNGACMACHHDGDSPKLNGVRPSLAVSNNLHAATPDNLLRVILDGIGHPARPELGYMPAFRNSLNNEQIIALARYLREDFAGLPAWPDLEFKVAKLR